MGELHVLLVDDQRVLAESLAVYLREQEDIASVAVATSGQSAVRLARSGADVVVLDHHMDDGESGAEILEALVHLGLGGRVLVLSAQTAVEEMAEEMAEALANGARGFWHKDTEPAAILDAIRRVARGEDVMPPGSTGPVLRVMADRHRQRVHAREELAALTPREIEVLRMLGNGLPRQQIATRLGLSPNTVRTHVQRLLAKLSLHSQLEAAAAARRLLDD